MRGPRNTTIQTKSNGHNKRPNVKSTSIPKTKVVIIWSGTTTTAVIVRSMSIILCAIIPCSLGLIYLSITICEFQLHYLARILRLTWIYFNEKAPCQAGRPRGAQAPLSFSSPLPGTLPEKNRTHVTLSGATKQTQDKEIASLCSQ